MLFDLLVQTPDKPRREFKQWEGSDGENACYRYADTFPGHVVYAWRPAREGLHIGLLPILEPGDSSR